MKARDLNIKLYITHINSIKFFSVFIVLGTKLDLARVTTKKHQCELSAQNSCLVLVLHNAKQFVGHKDVIEVDEQLTFHNLNQYNNIMLYDMMCVKKSKNVCFVCFVSLQPPCSSLQLVSKTSIL